MDVLKALAAHAVLLEGFLLEEADDRASEVSCDRGPDDEEPDPSTSPRAAKRTKKSTLELSDVPMDLPPIPSDKPGSASRFKGVSKQRNKWAAQITIPSEGGQIFLGYFDSEEEAGIMHARARYKYPAPQPGSWSKKPCPLDLSGVPTDLPPIPSETPGSSSRFKGVYKKGKKWGVKISIASKGGYVNLSYFDSEEEAGVMYARARYKYPVEERDYSYLTKPCLLDLSDVPMNLPPIPSDTPGASSCFKGVKKHGKKWEATIHISSVGGQVYLGIFDSEEEAGIMFARARYKYKQ